MNGILQGLRELLQTARYALEQLWIAVPDYGADAVARAARLALLALALFAAVLLAYLLTLLPARGKKRRPIAAAAGTLAAVLALGAWVYRPLPVAGPGTVERVSLVRMDAAGAEETLRLTAEQQAGLTALLERARCVRSPAGELPAQPERESAYRIVCETAKGETSVLVTRTQGARYTSAEKGLIYPLLFAEKLYAALEALA